MGIPIKFNLYINANSPSSIIVQEEPESNNSFNSTSITATTKCDQPSSSTLIISDKRAILL